MPISDHPPAERIVGVEHEVVNDNDFAIAFVEIELKQNT